MNPVAYRQQHTARSGDFRIQSRKPERRTHGEAVMQPYKKRMETLSGGTVLAAERDSIRSGEVCGGVVRRRCSYTDSGESIAYQ